MPFCAQIPNEEDLLTSNQASGKTTARQIRIVGVVVFGAFLALLNQTVMSPALPAIMADFDIDASSTVDHVDLSARERHHGACFSISD